MSLPDPGALRVVLVTAGAEEAPVLARKLLEARLVACVNLLPGVRSLYRWQGKVCDEPETLMVMKTTAARVDDLMARVAEWHSYDCPECIALPVHAALAPYAKWVVENSREEDAAGT